MSTYISPTTLTPIDSATSAALLGTGMISSSWPTLKFPKLSPMSQLMSIFRTAGLERENPRSYSCCLKKSVLLVVLLLLANLISPDGAVSTDEIRADLFLPGPARLGCDARAALERRPARGRPRRETRI